MKAAALVARGTEHFNAGRPKQALADFRAAARLGRPSAEVRYFTAHAHLALGQMPDALEAFAALNRAYPDYLPAYLDLANLLHQQGRLLDATKTLRAALKRSPGDEAALRRLAELEAAQAEEPRIAAASTRARRPASKRSGALIAGRAAKVPAVLSASSERVFKLADGPLRVKRLGNLPIELLALLAGVKPVIHLTTRPGDRDELETMAKRLGLWLHAFPLGVMLGRDAAALSATAALWDRENVNPGESLGYPPCCAAWYYEHADLPGQDIVNSILANTRKKKKLPFALNNVFYFFSRIRSIQEGARRQQLAAMNPGLDLDILNLIPWHPCSYDCAPSRAKAAKIWATARKVAPELAAALKKILARPVVFWDWSRFAALEKKDGRLTVGSPYSLLEPGLIAKLEAASEIRSTPKGLELFQGRKSLGLLGGSPAPILLDYRS